MKYIRGKLLSKQEEGKQCIIRVEGDLTFHLISSLSLRHKNIGDIVAIYSYEHSDVCNGKIYPVADVVKPRKTILTVISQNLKSPIDEVEAMWEDKMSYDHIINELYITNKKKR